MCCLSCYLPLLIGDLVPKDDDDCLTHTFQVSRLGHEYHAFIIILSRTTTLFWLTPNTAHVLFFPCDERWILMIQRMRQPWTFKMSKNWR